ncbi:MAG: hypothetical protein ABI565_03420 [Vicinamibacteria bacterium]
MAAQTADRLRISEIKSARDPLFKKSFALYSRVFPPSETIDREYFRNVFEEKRLGLLSPYNFHFLVAHQGNRVLGFVTGSYLAIVNLGFVGYLAVGPNTGGRKVGSKLRGRLIRVMHDDARAAGHADLMGMMGEVEEGNPWLHRMRRHGALAFDLDYMQPSTDGTSAVPLVLYLEPLGGRRLRSLPATTLRRLLYAVYRRLYRIRFPLKEPEFRRMLRQLEGRARVGARPLRDEAPLRPGNPALRPGLKMERRMHGR